MDNIVQLECLDIEQEARDINLVRYEDDVDTKESEMDGTDESIVEDILRRHFDWDERRSELDSYLNRIKKSYTSNSNSMLQNQKINIEEQNSPNEAKQKQEEEERRISILKGLHKIRQLDTILKEKTSLAKTMRSESHVETRSPIPEYDSDDEFELKSISSGDINTFVTEPKMEKRRKRIISQGIRKGNAGHEDNSQLLDEDQAELAADQPKLKGYKKGDFIQRNIVLGPNARFYHAMTEEETFRVENILKKEEMEDDINIQDDESVISANSNLSVFRLPWIETNDSNELESLADIDRKLVSMGSRGLSAGSGRFSHTSSASRSLRDANSIVFTEPQAVEDWVRTIEIENIRLKEIDKRLDELQAAHHETELPLAPREDIERLLDTLRAA